MKKFVLATIAILGIVAVSEASDCRRVVRVQQINHAAAIVHHAAIVPVVAAVYAPIPVYHSYAADPTAQLKSDLQALKAENTILRLEQRIQALESAQPQAVQKKEALQGEHPAIGILRKNCMECHGSISKKGSLAIFEGSAIAKMTDSQLRKIGTRTYKGTMPPKDHKQLTDEEIGQVQDWLDTIK